MTYSYKVSRGFGSRAMFVLDTGSDVTRTGSSSRPMARLVVEGVTAAEEGAYRCRVDFRTAQTRNTIINMSLIGG